MVIKRSILTLNYDEGIIRVLGRCNHYEQHEKISNELENLELNVFAGKKNREEISSRRRIWV